MPAAKRPNLQVEDMWDSEEAGAQPRLPIETAGLVTAGRGHQETKKRKAAS